jgi:hypothetical protein
MKAFYSVGGNGPGLSQPACFALVKRLLTRNEGRSLATEDRLRVLRSITLHRGKGPEVKGLCLIVNDKSCLENATGPAWDSLLKKLGADSRATMPPQFDAEPFCGGDSLYKIASPAPGDGGEVRHVMLESRSGRFENLLEEVTNVDGARAAIVTMTSEAKGPMTCIMVEFSKEGVTGGALESLFPSAEVIRVSDDSRRLVFTHLGSSCRWMFEAENDVVLVPVLVRDQLEENRALVTFRGEDGALEAVLFNWTRSDESGLGSFVKLSLNTPDRPLFPRSSAEALADSSVDMPVWLARDDRATAEDSRVYVISDQTPLFAKVISRIVDAAELSGQGALSYALWADPASDATFYAFRCEYVPELESYRDVRSYRILDSQLAPYGLAVRAGYRFLPEMPGDHDWGQAIKLSLFDSVGASGAAWALVDPCAQSDEGLAGVSAVIVPEFKPFERYRKHIGVFGPVVRAELIAEENERHREFSARAEQAWHRAAEVEKAQRDAYAQALFDQIANEAEGLDASLGAMRDDVQATKDMAAPLFAEAKLTREGLEQTTESFKKAVSGAAVKSANWIRLQKQLQENVNLLEAYVKMLDDSVRSHAQAELGRIKAQDLALTQRLAELKRAEDEVVQAHAGSASLVARLEAEAIRVESEIERLGHSVALDAVRVAEFDGLTAKMRSLADLEHAKELQSLKLRLAYAQCDVREAEVRDELLNLEKSKTVLADKLKDVANQTSEITRRREAVRLAGVDVRNAEAERENNIRALRQEEKSLADMIKNGDPRLAARELLEKAKSIRGQIAEVEEGGRLLADGDAEIAKLQARLDDLLQGVSLDGLQVQVRGSQDALVVLERAIAALEEALAADDILRRNPIAAGNLSSWDRFRSEAARRLKSARSTYLRSRNPLDPPLLDEINAAIDSLKQLP